MDLTNDDVADILALLDSLPYDALDLRTDRFRLTLRRTPSGWTEESELLVPPTDMTPVPDAPGAPGTPGGTGGPGGVARPDEPVGCAGLAGGEAGGADVGSADADGLIAVVAALPGTFYRAPRPGAPPFVEVGDVVGADTVVAIIETMKLMNSVPAGTRGRVERIIPDNGEQVVLGATLLLIDPNPAP